ncbi:MAG TPA: translation initiation factor IF-3 [Candidatus Atribacteria bacterium]|nr:translation initiation factor IF-3 [Atribacterota bacterium]HOQ50716.1 translation initiation factor IF-3 [Candidatus Atribacteria bacterium]MDI9607392.1 translation initiation factor IF-3 [Atribacterota bacterium]HPT63366.1 translation initiation factor IF-3 [Candidatus Atribacteria bacterium]HPZ40266.1 translation initiation factor IF-3 [Candidatus Atribacteria bacterium]
MSIEVKYRVNHQIGAREVRLISPEGEQLGVVPLKKALEMAEEAGLDLVEVAPDAHPPVCRIMDYGKFRYEKEKKIKLSRKKQKTSELKQLNLRPKIDQHDYEVKLRNALRFLEDGDRVKITVRFRGREAAFRDRGEELLKRMIADLEEVGKVEQDIKYEGPHLTITLAPRK